ncbi:MAG: hypothetical protein PXX73_08220 [Sideroxydans sp.]|nr:hypothetical protein [Sideroxydans sp.]
MKNTMQRGFSLISAIFLLVVIAALGMFAVTLSTTQHQSQTMEMMGARAYQAALAGVEWAAYQVGNSPANAVAPIGCTQTLTGLGGNLSAFSVAVSCTAVSAVEGTTTVWVYEVVAKASAGGVAGDANYTEQVATSKLVK